MTHWYVLTTPPQRELAAVTVLQRYGIEAWTPVEHVEQRPRKRAHHAEPLFKLRPVLARYVLARLAAPSDVSAMLYAMSRTSRPVVTGYLGSYGRPVPVPDHALDTLRDIHGRQRCLTVQKRALHPGQIVHIHGRPATVSRVRGHRATAVMDWLGSQREIQIDVREYAKAS